MLLKRFTIEKSSTISDDYVVFLQEHQVDNDLMDDNPINVHQAINSSDSQKWIDAMNVSLNPCKTMTFGILSHYLKV